MVGNRPVAGVRNPVGSTSTSSYSRAKNAGTGLPEKRTARTDNKPTVSPSPAAGGGVVS